MLLTAAVVPSQGMSSEAYLYSVVPELSWKFGHMNVRGICYIFLTPSTTKSRTATSRKARAVAHSPRRLELLLNHPREEISSPKLLFGIARGGADTTHGRFPMLAKATRGVLESGKGVRPGVRADGGARDGSKMPTSRLELLVNDGSING